jgi:hypothetical protein
MKLTFTIRHLLIAVTLFAVLFGWITHQLNWIKQRHNLLVKIGYDPDPTYSYLPPRHELFPWSLKLFGEEPVVGGELFVDTPNELEYANSLFPEGKFQIRPPPVFSRFPQI